MAAPAPRWSTRLGHVAQHTVATGPAAAGVSAGIGSFRLDGRVAVITGGARHFGLEIAHALGSAGCSLVVTSRTAESAEAAARALASAHSVDTIGLPLDVSVAEDVERMSAQAIAWKGHVDVLVNNAGGGSGPSAPVGGIFERDITAAETLLRANLLGSYLTCKAFGRHMAERGYGKIINIGSISGLLGRDDRMYVNNGMERQPIDYAMAKAGVNGLTMDLAGHLGPLGVRVNCIAPGGFASDCPSPNGGIDGKQQAGAGRSGPPPGFIRDFSRRVPLGHMGRDGIDLGGTVLFLAAPASDYVVGQTLVVDGGFSIWH